MLREFLLILIKLYWKLIPENKRRVCIYKDSCSNFIFRITKDKGIVNGIKALIYRLRNCNNSYTIHKKENILYIETSKGELIYLKDINPLIVKGF